MPDFQTLQVETLDDHILRLTFNRPHVGNAMNTAMLLEILAFLAYAADRSPAVRCLLVTGAGTRFFCAGGDLKERHGMSDVAWKRQHALVERMVRELLDFPCPVIAAVNGLAYGGGCEFTLSADFAYAAEQARFCLPETSLGIIPGAGGTQALMRATGPRRAKEIIFTAAPFSAHEALAWGLVNAVVPGEKLQDFALERAQTIARNAPLAIRQAKKSMRHGLEMDLRTALFFEIEAYNHLVGTDDRREGVAAFAEKRRPVFEGR